MAYRRPKKRRAPARGKARSRRSNSSNRRTSRRSVARSSSSTVRVVIENRQPAPSSPEELANSMLARTPKRSRF